MSVSHESLVQALHQRYGQSVSQLHQEVAELSAALQQVTTERDEARKIASEYITLVNHQRDVPPLAPEPNLFQNREPDGKGTPQKLGYED